MVAVGVIAAQPDGALAQLTFDDVPGASCNSLIPGGYGGFSWSNFRVANTTCRPLGFADGVVSGTWAAYNSGGTQARMTSNGLFTFNSAYFTAWVPETFDMTVKGFRSGSEIYSTVLNLTRTTQLATLNWTDVDKMTFEASNQLPEHWFVMDDMSTNVVPEPGTLVLLGTGLFGVAAIHRRRRRDEEFGED
jgi:hypothetical protein